jgi:hypothetical protein
MRLAKTVHTDNSPDDDVRASALNRLFLLSPLLVARDMEQFLAPTIVFSSSPGAPALCTLCRCGRRRPTDGRVMQKTAEGSRHAHRYGQGRWDAQLWTSGDADRRQVNVGRSAIASGPR